MKRVFLISGIIYLMLTFHISNGYYEYTSCYQQFGIGAKDNYDGTCSCLSGYGWGKDFLGKNQCVPMSTLCTNKYGLMASYSFLDNSCQCLSGYVFGNDVLGNFSCIDGNQACHQQFGYNSKFNQLTNKCQCDEGYTLRDGKCEQKQNNVYFFLKELISDNREAIIKSNYDSYSYHITYGLGCYSIRRYIGKNIVVNLGTDFDLDRWDKIILQDDNEECNIVTKSKVDTDYSLRTCEDAYGSNTMELVGDTTKCTCKTGYKWDLSETYCVPSLTFGLTEQNFTEGIKPPLFPIISNQQEVQIVVEKVFNKLTASYGFLDSKTQAEKYRNFYLQLSQFDGRFSDDKRVFILKYLKYLTAKKEKEANPTSITLWELNGN